MSPNIKVLDCTLRDGGYYTDWDFDESFVSEMISSLSDSGVDIIEMGYKSPQKGGKFRKCNDSFISGLIPGDINVDFAFMIDLKDFLYESKINSSLIDDVIGPSCSSPFSYCRIAIKPKEINHLYELYQIIKSKGYRVIVNLMTISLVKDDELFEILNTIEHMDIECFYVADSYGSLLHSDISNLVKNLLSCGKSIGLHTHNNSGLAFANCIEGIKCGVSFFDGTLLGMGRGAGNVHTEQLVEYLQHSKIKKDVDYTPLLPIIKNHIESLRRRYKWGFSSGYMLSALNNIHPLYCQELQASNIEQDSVDSILSTLTDELVFDINKINKYLDQKVAVIIPARYKSSRFPGKPIAKILDRPMIIWVAEIAEKAVGIDNVYIATENSEIAKVVKSYGYKIVLTSDSCMTGTDRVAEAAEEIDADIFVNIQGDEPLLNYNDILRVVESKKKNPEHVINCMAAINRNEKASDKKIPKVVVNNNDELLYASRAIIPSTKDGDSVYPKKQVCIYAFSKSQLRKFTSVSEKTANEWCEDIEIIRFLELGIPVKMVEVDGASIAVDYESDISAVERIIKDRADRK